MATVRLYDPEDLEYELPQVCMRCGADSTVYKDKRFSWHPGWVGILLLFGLLPYVIVALVMTKRMRVEAPLCDRHRNHWFLRQALILGTLVGLLVLIFVAVANSTGPNQRAAGVLWVGVAFGFLGWIVLALIVHLGTIRPSEITEDSITLQGVSQDFKDAVKDARREEEEEDDREPEIEDRRDRPRRRRNEPDDGRFRDADDARRRRPRPDEEFLSDEP